MHPEKIFEPLQNKEMHIKGEARVANGFQPFDKITPLAKNILET